MLIPTTACSKRLLKELREIRQTADADSLERRDTLSEAIDHSSVVLANPPLGPIEDTDILTWKGILLGPSGTAYEHGQWEMCIEIPPTYPLHPPVIRFVTPCCHPNVSIKNGEICLDLLRAKGGWSPAYTIVKTLEAIQMLLAYPSIDSPLNVDIATLIRAGDEVGAEGVIRWWCNRHRWSH